MTQITTAIVAAVLSVQAMVVGPAGVVVPARTVHPRAVTVKVAGGRRCAVAADTPLGVLEALHVSVAVRDYGSCSRNPRDSGALFVYRVAGQTNSGENGWVYKVNGRAGTAGAGDPSSPLHGGQQVLWFWCRISNGACQHTLGLHASVNAQGVTLIVTGYDDNGRGTPVAGAEVTFAATTETSGPTGAADFPLPATPGHYAANATDPGLVPAFPLEVTVP